MQGPNFTPFHFSPFMGASCHTISHLTILHPHLPRSASQAPQDELEDYPTAMGLVTCKTWTHYKAKSDKQFSLPLSPKSATETRPLQKADPRTHKSWVFARSQYTISTKAFKVFSFPHKTKKPPTVTVQISPQATWKSTSHVQDGTSLPTRGKKKSNNRFWILFLKEEIFKFSITEHSCVVSEL